MPPVPKCPHASCPAHTQALRIMPETFSFL
jgi:hypothetical protein